MFEKIKELLCGEFSLDPESITLESSLKNDLGINSIELADFVLSCEDEFGISISDKDIRKFITVGDVVNYISAK